MNLKDRIDALVSQRAEQIIAEMFGLGDETRINKADDYRLQDRAGRSIDDPAYGTPQRENIANRGVDIDGADVEPTRRRKRGRGRAKVEYVTNPRHRGRWPDLGDTTTAIVFSAIRKGAGLSNLEIEKATGLKQKTVESDVYRLRRDGVIVSRRRKRSAE
jgi:hypothetical protein